MYEVIETTFPFPSKIIKFTRVDDQIFWIPFDEGNTDYQRYLEWVASSDSESPDSDGQTAV